MSLSSNSLDFGNTFVGTSAGPSSVTLQNSGNAMLALNGIAVTGAANTDYTPTNHCGPSLAAGSSCTLNISFTPTAAGARGATLQITDNAVNSPQSVALTGMGIGTHSVTLNWDASTSPSVIGYFVYHSPQPGGPYILLNSAQGDGSHTPVAGPPFQDHVPGHQTWYWVVTAVDSNFVESLPSTEKSYQVPP